MDIQLHWPTQLRHSYVWSVARLPLPYGCYIQYTRTMPPEWKGIILFLDFEQPSSCFQTSVMTVSMSL